MILSDKDIRDRVLNYQKYDMEAPILEPFSEEKLQGASYDISITNKIYIFENKFKVLDILNQNDIDDIYDEIDISEGYCLAPNEYILTTLNEIINLPKDLVAHIRPRTRFIRLGIVISHQHINPLSTAKLKIGIHNCTPYAIKIYPNLGIGQFVFETLTSIPTEDKLYKRKTDASYRNDIEFIGAKVSHEFQKKIAVEYSNLIKNILVDGE